MGYRNKLIAATLIMTLVISSVFAPVAQAGVLDSIAALLDGTGAIAGVSDSSGQSTLEKVLGLLLALLIGSLFDKGGNDAKPPTGGGTSSLQGKTIVLDPGHGGGNPGAVGFNGTYEKDHNLAVALKVKPLLERAGAKVVMTRNTDRYVAPSGSTLGQELQARVDIAEQNRADLFVSIHANANTDSTIHGAMTFYYSEASKKLAQSIQAELIRAAGAVDKGIESATFYVLRTTSMPAVLVETGFITNPAEERLLVSDSYRQKLAQGIYNGILAYYGN